MDGNNNWLRNTSSDWLLSNDVSCDEKSVPNQWLCGRAAQAKDQTDFHSSGFRLLVKRLAHEQLAKGTTTAATLLHTHLLSREGRSKTKEEYYSRLVLTRDNLTISLPAL